MISPTSATPPRRIASSDDTFAATKMTAIWSRRPFASVSGSSALRVRICAVEKVHQVDDGNRGARRAQAGGDLHLTAGVRGHDELRAAARDVSDLALEKLGGQLWLRDVV